MLIHLRAGCCGRRCWPSRAALLARAIQVGDGMLGPGQSSSALAWLSGALLAMSVAVFGADAARLGSRRAGKSPSPPAQSCVLLNLVQFGMRFPASYIELGGFTDYAPFLSGIVAAAMLAGLNSGGAGWTRDVAFAGLPA
jgi:hypothetical protein